MEVVVVAAHRADLTEEVAHRVVVIAEVRRVALQEDTQVHREATQAQAVVAEVTQWVDN